MKFICKDFMDILIMVNLSDIYYIFIFSFALEMEFIIVLLRILTNL